MEEWTVEQGLDLMGRTLNPLIQEMHRIVEQGDYHSFNQLVTALDYVCGMVRQKLEEDVEGIQVH
jgi:hypothetical protein